MNFELGRVAADERIILDRLLQLYLYEIGMEPCADGLIDWGESLDDFFTGQEHMPLFLKVDGGIVGFALVKLNRRLVGADGHTPVSANFVGEFFVLRPHRRRKFGTNAARRIFTQYLGSWMISCWPDPGRVRFWRHVARECAESIVREYGPDEYKGFPGQHVWVIDTAKCEDQSP